MVRTKKPRSSGYVEVKGEYFGYDAIRQNEAGETEYHLDDTDEWATYERVEEIMDELLAEERENWNSVDSTIRMLSRKYRGTK